MIKGEKEAARNKIGKEDVVPYILIDIAERYGDLFPSLRDCYDIKDYEERAKDLYIKELYHRLTPHIMVLSEDASRQ